MRKALFRLFVLISATALTACNSDDKIKVYKSHEILVVKVDIIDDLIIDKITLRSSNGQFTDSILRKEIGNEKTFKVKCPQKGEGIFSICVFTNKDTLCSKDSYIEGSYIIKYL